ncbi:MAG: (Fe-S)-binding protein [Acidimicrobiales bacterium]
MAGAKRDRAELLKDCVHCGFCLPSCPTYVLWGEEMDSPRGRINLMSQVESGETSVSEVALHMDRCLGCMACVTACPSGVRYDRLVELARAEVEQHVRRPFGERMGRSMIFGLLCHPRRLLLLRPLLRAYQKTGFARIVRRPFVLARLPRPLRAMEALCPSLTAPAMSLAPREVTPACGPRRGSALLLLGCVQRVLFADVNAATARVLAAEGVEVLAPPSQGCCGALSLHAGRTGEFRRLARRLMASFERASSSPSSSSPGGLDYVVANSAGCASAMKDYGELFSDDLVWRHRAEAFSAKVRDIAELIDELGPVARRHPLPLQAAYHDACHLAHAQGVRAAPRRLLGGIPGLELFPVKNPELCCGSAGIYNLVQAEPGEALGDRKADDIIASGADVLVAGNAGCLMQIGAALRRRGHEMALYHTVELLDASISGSRDVGRGPPDPSPHAASWR